jgi:hypothetical protein
MPSPVKPPLTANFGTGLRSQKKKALKFLVGFSKIRDGNFITFPPSPLRVFLKWLGLE